MLVLYFGIGWLLGLWLASVLRLGFSIWIIAGAFGLVASFGAARRGKLSPLLLVTCAAGLGGARYLAAVPVIDASHVAYYNGTAHVTLTGMVTEAPDIRDSYVNLRVAVDTLSSQDRPARAVSGIVLVRSPRFPLIEYGTRIEVNGVLETPPIFDTFNYKEYLARQGINSLLTDARPTVHSVGEGTPFKEAILAFKDKAQRSLNRVIPEPQAALLSGILLGEDKQMSPELRDAFRDTGLTHIIAISGFNVAILVGVLMRVSQAFLPRRGAVVFAMVGLAAYTVLVGFGASIVRAAVMGCIYLLTLHGFGRTHFVYAALFLAAVLMTLVEPFALWDVGFQLSFAATLGLILYSKRISRWIRERLERTLDRNATNQLMWVLTDSVIVTLAAQILTLPLAMSYFGQLSLISLPANAAVLLAQPGAMVWGGMATLAGLVSTAAGQLLGWIAWLFLAYTTELARWFSRIPGATLRIDLSPAGVLAIYALIFSVTWLGMLNKERRAALFARLRPRLPQRITLASFTLAALLILAWGLSQPDGRLHVTFMDVGQGDAIFIQTPSGRQILVDGGKYPSVLNDELGQEMPFWDREIDIVVATHPDADHVSGLPGVLKRYRVGRLITDGEQLGVSELYDELLVTAEEERIEVYPASAGETIEIGDGVRLELLNPGPELPSESRNENSVSMRVVYGEFALLLTGDAEQKAERTMLANSEMEGGRPLVSQVFKAGHHGSRSSSNSYFLEAVRPQFVIISAGEQNRFGHPHVEVLERAAAVGATVLGTDELGTIELTTDGRLMWWDWRPKSG